MGKIIILDEYTSNKIAAGEVIERPASVIKELVENSIDAGAGSISVEIRNGGISYIKVTDNGSGMDEDDVVIAFERHGTSKIRNSDDLEGISTLGFRGEALASIAAVSRVQMVTRVQDKPYGMQVLVEGGNVREVKQTGCPVGTTFTIRDLFFNTPARFKFLKKDSTEAGYISDMLERIALGNPQISFKLTNTGTTVLHTPGNNDLRSTIFSIYGREIARSVHEVDYHDGRLHIYGFVGKPEIARSNRSQQSLFINGRYVKSKLVASAADEAYKTLLMKNKFPFFVMNIDVNPVLVDVNVHPTKMEVRFSNEQDVFRAVYHAIHNAVLGGTQIKTVWLEEKGVSPFKLDGGQEKKEKYTQQSFELPKSIGQRKAPTLQEDTETKKDKTNPGWENRKTAASETELKEITKKVPNEIVPNVYQTPKESFTPTGASEAVYDISPPVQKPEEKPAVLNREEPEKNTQEERKNSMAGALENARLVGQAFGTFVILQKDNELILIDQHAAHERILFERLKKGYDLQSPMSQMLVAPVSVELTHKEKQFLKEKEEFFNRTGFIFESFGNNSIILRAVPYAVQDIAVKESFIEMIDAFMETQSLEPELFIGEALYTIACKAAVKANSKLDEREIQGLLEQLTEIENPFTCPHGRPTAVKLSRYELEKMFKRIL